MDIESTSVVPRQRPRPADSSVRPPTPSSAVGVCEPATAVAVAAVDKRPQQRPVQPPQPVQQPDSLLLLSDEPHWPDERQQTSAPLDNTSALIDLDPADTLLANLDPLTAAFPACHRYRPSFGYGAPRASFCPSSFGRFGSPPGQIAAGFVAYPPPGVGVPHQFLSYPMHSCSQQAVGHAAAPPYAAQSTLVPQYRGVVAPGKTGSNNDLHLLQV